MENLWLIFALLAAITASLVAIFGKLGLEGVDSTTATTIRAVVMTLFLISVIAIEGKIMDIPSILTNNKAMYYIILSGIAGALSWLFYFLALKFGKVSQVVPIDRLSIVFAIILSVLFLGEKINIKSGIGALLIIAGAMIIAMS